MLPGDQLVFVNDTYLDTCTLAQAVEVLKAAPSGTVYLGICKPLVVRTAVMCWGLGLSRFVMTGIMHVKHLTFFFFDIISFHVFFLLYFLCSFKLGVDA